MQGFAHARIPTILENEVWLPHTPNPRTCWTFFNLQSSLFPSPISFLSSSFLLHPRNSRIFSSLQLCEYLHPPQVLSKKKKKKDFQFMTIHLFWVFAITHMEKKTPLFGLSFLSASLHSTADSFTIFKVRLTIYKKAETEGVDLIISQLGIGLAHKLLKTVSTLYNHSLRGRKKSPKTQKTTGHSFILFHFILVESNTW